VEAGDGGGGDGDGPNGGPGARPAWWRRHPVMIVAAVVVLVAASVGLYTRTRAGHEQPAEQAGIGAQSHRAPKIAPTQPTPPPTMVPPVSELPTTTVPSRAPTATTPSQQPKIALDPPGPIRDADYRLDFSDDFDGSAPDPGTWATAPFGGSLPPTVSDGALTVKTTASNAYRWGYVASTGARSQSEPNYPNAKAWERGYFEARIRYTDTPWAWPAFWLFSMAKTEAWPHEDCSNLDAEWDVMENGVDNETGDKPASEWYLTALHRNTSDNTDDGYCGTKDEWHRFEKHMGGTNLSDWHIWSAYWAQGTFCTYMDDVKIQCMEPFDSTAQPMHLVFDIQTLQQCDGCPPRPDELEMQIDWVRVWQAG
jgi:hypothetical protein